MQQRPRRAAWRDRLGNVIFNNDTRAGRVFDALLTLAIMLSVLLLMLGSVRGIGARYGPLIGRLELGFTLLFSAEYLLRLVTARRAGHYVRSFFGVVDALSILPGYLGLLVPGAQYLLVVRMLRLVRIFRILHLGKYVVQARVLSSALRASTAKITVFLLVVLILVVLVGTLMYVLEGPSRGFTSIPTSVYWAIVTLTTVGYGDLSPQTPLGKALASLVMILGYGIIAVPTGLITAGLVQAQTVDAQSVEAPTVDSQAAETYPLDSPLSARPVTTCPRCGLQGHAADARYCRRCGERLLQRAAEAVTRPGPAGGAAG